MQEGMGQTGEPQNAMGVFAAFCFLAATAEGYSLRPTASI